MLFRSSLLSNRTAMSPAGPEHDRLRPPPYLSSAHGSVSYSPRRPTERSRRAHPGRFPAPLIEPRQRRPHSIHIISYPPGFVPHDLRPSSPGTKLSKREKRESKAIKKQEARERKREEKNRKRAERERTEKQEKRRSLLSLPESGESVGRVIDKIFAALSITPKPAPTVSATPVSRDRPRSLTFVSFVSFVQRLSRREPAVEVPIFIEEPVPGTPIMTGVAGARPRPVPAGTTVMSANRNSMMSIRSAKTMISSSISEVQKPVASGSGVSCSILLAEPNVFLTGFDHDHHTRRGGQTTSALLRGKLQLNVSKNVKIKSITLKLVGKARTEWPEGIPPHKTDLYEEQVLRTQSLVFFHAMHEGMWDTEYGSQCTYTHKAGGLISALQPTASTGSLHILGKGRSSTLTAKELKRLSLQSVNSRSFGKGDSPHINQVQVKGYKVFHPGIYEYTFELPIDHNQLETAKLPYGSVRWDLETTVERAGAFKPNLHGTREVPIVRLPDQMSLETVEPISISRNWEDQLHYDIVISGKSFPIGGRIPIAFKLTPLAKVQLHKLKVFVTENAEYWTNNRHVTRKDPGRKILLFEKTAGRPVDKQYAASEMRVLSGGELDPLQRQEARRTAACRRMREAARNRGAPEPLPEPSDNLLGDLELGLESFWASTEIEMNVQLPTCDMMARDKTLRLHPDCSWKNVNVFHWIKVVMRISRADPDDPTGKRRRHFEISIDSPFTVLNCRATRANTALPQYSGSGGPVPEQRQQMTCGCPDAQPLDQSPAGLARPLTMTEEDFITLSGRQLRLDCSMASRLPAQPQAAHVHAARGVPQQSTLIHQARPETSHTPVEERPIHLIRHPSHNPPAFDADESPPELPLQTPPPCYDLIVGTPSVDGLADYFARLAAYEGVTTTTTTTTTRAAAGNSCHSHQPNPDAVVTDRSDSDSDTNTIGPDTTDTTTGLPITASTTSASAQRQQPCLLGGGVGPDENDNDVDPFRHLRPTPSGSPGAPGAGGILEAVAAEEAAPPQHPHREEEEGVHYHHHHADDASSSSSASDDDLDDDGVGGSGQARLHRRGRVNVANPRTPGGRLVPSRSLEDLASNHVERPAVRLDMAGVLLRRRGM
ncbi:hypothetical protein N657DRAFT_580286 [Parathielavia appendiculata]|uniref:Arrestin C-terminal-like domain-containing protein n=1 Tax=Parathielavia appendiculata TaxID=2587402 RepID=A0AAN6Z088_9PEZI|nr:hypothetical protein N657DRAFT_580286 [Parathielavia appendiculata]